MKVVYSAQAIEDLKALRSFIATHNPDAAKRISAELLNRINHLIQFPEMGKQVATSPTPNIRDCIFGQYIVRYAIHKDAISILKIWHHNQQRSI